MYRLLCKENPNLALDCDTLDCDTFCPVTNLEKIPKWKTDNFYWIKLDYEIVFLITFL